MFIVVCVAVVIGVGLAQNTRPVPDSFPGIASEDRRALGPWRLLSGSAQRLPAGILLLVPAKLESSRMLPVQDVFHCTNPKADVLRHELQRRKSPCV
jgi:hypothetical protein